DGQTGPSWIIGNDYNPDEYFYWVEIQIGFCLTRILFNDAITPVNMNDISDIIVYPNPAFNYFTISGFSHHDQVDIRVLDSAGRICMNHIYSGLSGKIFVDISTLNAGWYAVEVQVGKEIMLFRILKTHI
ncbi:MAG: T9SS type A sorting domain-containing protein, partial [Flavobacteriales bacterium]